jgi:ribosomal protein S27E
MSDSRLQVRQLGFVHLGRRRYRRHTRPGTLGTIGKAADWLREERRRTLGDWVALCPSCGHGQRYFEGGDAEVPTKCPTCGTGLVTRCPDCAARIASMFAVACEECGAALRAASGFGVPIRREPRS